jgi:hypothetical protein
MQTVARPVMQEAEQKYMDCVPHQVTHKGVHHVCHMKPVKVNAILRKDLGHWDEQPCEPPTGCHSCCAPKTRKVWVPNIVDKPIQVTVMRPEVVQQPYEYTCTVMRPEMRTRKVQVCTYVYEQHPCEVRYTVCVPQQRTKTFNVTTYKCVPEEHVQKYQVCVPKTVEKQVEVRVCRMVEKTIHVPACGSCY